MNADVLLCRLTGVKKRGEGKWIAQCPAHEDRKPSLSIVENPDGRILMHDFGGCDTQTVLHAVGLTVSDLFPKRLADNMPAQRGRVHAHAANDVMKIMAHEGLVLLIIGESMHRGKPPSASELDRIGEAVVVLREASELV